jgi:hypothetical protein
MNVREGDRTLWHSATLCGGLEDSLAAAEAVDQHAHLLLGAHGDVALEGTCAHEARDSRRDLLRGVERRVGVRRKDLKLICGEQPLDLWERVLAGSERREVWANTTTQTASSRTALGSTEACSPTMRWMFRLAFTIDPQRVRPSQKRSYAVLVRNARMSAITAPAIS